MESNFSIINKRICIMYIYQSLINKQDNDARTYKGASTLRGDESEPSVLTSISRKNLRK